MNKIGGKIQARSTSLDTRSQNTWIRASVILVWFFISPMFPARGEDQSEVTVAGIQKALSDISSANTEFSQRAVARLGQARNHEEIAAILKAIDTATPERREQLLKILGDIGEPAASGVFACGVLAEGGAKSYSYATHALTCFVKLNAIPVLVDKLGSGSDQERKVAAWALWSITYYYGIGKHDPDRIISSLSNSAKTDPIDYVRNYSAKALCDMKHDACIPALVRLLDDERVRAKACVGLVKFGPKATAAKDMLRNGISMRAFPPEAIAALTSIEGVKTVPFVAGNLNPWPFRQDDRHKVVTALSKHPHPAAMPFMEEELWREGNSARINAAQFFATLDDPHAVEVMRRCLTVGNAGGKNSHANPSGTDLSEADIIRLLAVTSLLAHRDSGSYTFIQKILREDPSKKVRIAAAKGFGEIGWAQAVPDLIASIKEMNELKSPPRSEDAEFCTAAVLALGRIGTSDAHSTLYQGLSHKLSQQACARFWADSKDPELFKRFLGFYRESPVDDNTAARIISRHLHAYSLPEAQAAKTKEGFLASVRDPKYFGRDLDLTDAGKFQVEMTFDFYTIEFAQVSFEFRSSQRKYFGRGETILYRKEKAGWRPMASVGGWAE